MHLLLSSLATSPISRRGLPGDDTLYKHYTGSPGLGQWSIAPMGVGLKYYIRVHIIPIACSRDMFFTPLEGGL
jgi:hypothetical protein